MLRGLIAAGLFAAEFVACLAGEARAQPLTKGVRAILQTAATVCVEWASGRADFTHAPPPGYRGASPLERIGFNIGVGAVGELVTAVWISKTGAPFERAVIAIDGGCMAYSAFDLNPVGFDVIESTLETMMRRIDPDAPELAYGWTGEDGGFRTRYYTLDENPDLLVGVGQGWRNGRTARGPVYVIVKPW